MVEKRFNEKDIRPPELMKQKAPALDHDKKFLLNQKNRFVTVNCPACESNDYFHWGAKEGFSYDKCSMCRTIFMNPRAPLQLLHEFYAQSKNYEYWNKYVFPASESTRKEKIFLPRAIETVEYCKRHSITGGTILEVGAAFGTFCEAVKDLHYFDRIIAVEPTKDLADTCRMKGLETIELPIENVSLPHNSVDVIVNFEVIEHLFSPFSFLEKCVSLLKTGGLLISTCPNGHCVGTIVLKENAKMVDHEHVNYFNPESIDILFNRAGVKLLEITTPGVLDMDMLNNQFTQNPNLFLGESFFTYLLTQNNKKLLENMQTFIKDNLLSSHMWGVGIKK